MSEETKLEPDGQAPQEQPRQDTCVDPLKPQLLHNSLTTVEEPFIPMGVTTLHSCLDYVNWVVCQGCDEPSVLASDEIAQGFRINLAIEPFGNIRMDHEYNSVIG